MKRLGLLLLILPLLAAAEVVVPIDSVQNNINIRMSPDARSEIVGRLNQGDWVTWVSSSPEWHEVELEGGATGFISADWSNVLSEPPGTTQNVVAEEASEESLEEQRVAQVPVVDVEDTTVSTDMDEQDTKGSVGVDTVEDAVVAAAESEEISAEAVVEEVAVAEESQDPVVEDAAPDVAMADADAVDEIEIEEVVVDATKRESPAPESVVPVVVATAGEQGPVGPVGPMGPAGPAGAASVEGSVDFLMKFTAPTIGGNSQVFDDGNFIGIGTTEPKQRLEVNGNIQIHERNSSVAGLMITQSDGETGYIMHNRASTLTIGAGSIDRITVDRNGNVGFGVARPANPFELANGAHVTAGGVWTNASSRELKENIEALSADAALNTLADLEPVQFNYRNDQSEGHVGFIAEDVPDLVAMQDRDGLSAMDIVAVLTKVVQEQQKKIEALEARLDQR